MAYITKGLVCKLADGLYWFPIGRFLVNGLFFGGTMDIFILDRVFFIPDSRSAWVYALAYRYSNPFFGGDRSPFIRNIFIASTNHIWSVVCDFRDSAQITEQG